MRTKLSGKKVVIFGGAGFIGSHLVKCLCKESCQINIVSRNPKSTPPLFFANDPGQIKFKKISSFNQKEIDQIILTGSGGPFRTKDLSEFNLITKEQALKHPNWSMGNKITIDSATMMNKGLELIEAYWLFNLDIDRISILIHPESIIHSMV